jgi:hypothetical protein
MFNKHLNIDIKSRSKRSSSPDALDRVSPGTQMTDSEIDLVSRMLFGYSQFSVLRKIGRARQFFATV